MNNILLYFHIVNSIINNNNKSYEILFLINILRFSLFLSIFLKIFHIKYLFNVLMLSNCSNYSNWDGSAKGDLKQLVDQVFFSR